MARLPIPWTLVMAPGLLPKGLQFRVHRETERTLLFRRLVERLRPDCRCLGFIERPEPDSPASVLFCESDWPAAWEAFVRAGVPRERLLILPLPVGDVWSWWEFGRQMSDHLGADGRFCIDNEIFWRLVKAGSDPENWRRHYLSALPFAREPEVRSQLEQVCARLADDHSRQTLRRAFDGLPVELLEAYVQTTTGAIQYFECLEVRPGDNVLNIGIHDGTEIPFFLAEMAGLGAILNVDPSGDRHLSEYARTTASHFPGMTDFAAVAVAERAGNLPFRVLENGEIVGRAAEGDDGDRFPCLGLEDLIARLPGGRVDMVKIDIEGDEALIIGSLAEVANRYRPRIALSIYHHPSHYLGLPLVLMRNCPGYRFFVRHYGYKHQEVILYAVPE